MNTIKLSQFPPNTELLIIMEGEAGWRAEFVLVWINIGFLRSNCVFHNKIEITNLNRLFVLFFVNTLSVSARLQCSVRCFLISLLLGDRLVCYSVAPLVIETLLLAAISVMT